MAKHFIIYETKNLKNGKIYIGMHETEDLNDGYLGSGYHLKRAIRYYGKEFFERKILFDFDNREDMLAKEIEIVNEEFITRKDTYNIMTGGKGGVNSQSSIEKNRQKHLGNKNGMYGKTQTKYQKNKMSILAKILHREGKIKRFDWTGKKHSEKTKEKMRISQQGKQKGEKNSQFGTMWITNGIENKKIKKESTIPNDWKLGRKI